MTTNDKPENKAKRRKWALCLGIPAALIVLLLIAGTIWDDYEKPLKKEQLPVPAQEFIAEHYPSSKVAFARMEVEWLEWFKKEYKVVLTEGVQLDFDRNGEWKKVKCKTFGVPSSIVPDPIKEYLEENYPQQIVREISRDRREVEVELTNRLELTFSAKNFMLLDWDD